jgi:tRNA pseudouridine38-40 synthase
MQRWKLTLEYDGGAFLGWQSQPNGRGIQDALEAAIWAIDGGQVRVQAAGRTDAGVHATGQVAHADFQKDWRAWQLREALNARLLKLGRISVVEVEAVSADFHARFSATSRTYLYRIIERRAFLTIDKGKLWRVGQSLDVSAMQEAAAQLIGTHDFTTFRDAACQAKSATKTLDRFEISRTHGTLGPEVHAILQARSFLHRQVRSLMGTVVEVGKGRWSQGELHAALVATNRARCGPVAPSDGLYLTAVDYA